MRWTSYSVVVVLAVLCAGSAPAPYLTQRLAPFGLDMHEFPSTGRGVRTLRDRAAAASASSFGPTPRSSSRSAR